MSGIVLSLFDLTGNMVRPWAAVGYECVCVDVKHEGEEVELVGDGRIHYVQADIREYIPPRAEYRFVFGFPPCTNLATSGRAWFKDKGLEGLANGVELVEQARRIALWSDAPWMIENPRSTLSTYWRSPDYKFQPYEYDGYTDADEAYSKETWLWTSEDFVMPKPRAADEYDERIQMMSPSDDRSERRSVTPTGFSRAVFEANSASDVQYRRQTSRVACGDGGYIEHNSAAGDEINLSARDKAWLAILTKLRAGVRRFKAGDVDADVSRQTMRNVLKAMVDVGLLRQDGRVYHPGAFISDYVGRSVPSEGGDFTSLVEGRDSE